MKEFKDKMSEVLKELPVSEEEFFNEDKAEAFPNLIRLIGTQFSELYSKEKLVAAMMDKEKSLDFLVVLTELLKSFSVFNSWLDENSVVVEQSRTSGHIKGEFKKLKDLISDIQDSVTKSENDLVEVKKEKEQLLLIRTELEKKEQEHKRLVGVRSQIIERNAELKDLEQQVKQGKLEELEKENKHYESKYSKEETKRDSLLTDRDSLLVKQKNIEVDVQKIINQTSLVGNSEELFSAIKKKCIEHNEKMLKEQTEDVAKLLINLTFNERTSNGLLDDSNHSKLNNAKVLVKEVESFLKDKLN